MKYKNEINMCGGIFYYVGFILINHQETWELFRYELCEALERSGDAKGLKQRKLREKSKTRFGNKLEVKDTIPY